MHIVGERITIGVSKYAGWKECQAIAGVISLELRHRNQNSKDLSLGQIHVTHRASPILIETYRLSN